MTKNDFIQLIKERLEIADDQLSVETDIKSLNEWDSWNALELMTLVDETFDVNLSPEDIKEITTFQTLISRIGDEKFD
ncbi:MAG: acyl carrier protein [Porphyromonadaceae bacterium]|nr:acyl carrier protein [Porphyromonadaceae bacterium]